MPRTRHEPVPPRVPARFLTLLDELDRALADLRTLLAQETKGPDDANR